MKKYLLFPFFLFFFSWTNLFFASPWADLQLPLDLSERWKINAHPSSEKPGYFAIESRVIEKVNGYIGWVFLYPPSHGISPEEEIQQRMDRFLAAQPKDLKAVRTYWKYGNSPGEQLVYLLKDTEKNEILAWFTIIYWAYEDRLYSLTLSSLTDSPLTELDFFFSSQYGPKTIIKEVFLPY